MGWRDEMVRGSWRGVEFVTRDARRQLGRRTVTHEYPGRDVPYVEDLGRKGRVDTLTIFVIGDNYMQARAQLEAALEQAGPGELVHPWRGRMTAAVTNVDASESIDELGRAGWTVTWTETGENLQPSTRVDTNYAVEAAADTAIAAVEEDFTENFEVESQPEFVEADALTRVNAALDNVTSVIRGMMPDTGVLAAVIFEGQRIASKVTSLLRIPTSLANTVSSQIQAILGLGNTPLGALDALKRLFGYGASQQAIRTGTPARVAQEGNRQAVNNLVSRVAVIEAARAAANSDYDNRDQALEVRDSIADAIDEQSLTASDTVYNALVNLRAAMVQDINTRAADLNQLVSYTPRQTLPALVVAYSLYGDARRDEEIVTRNQALIRHPGFVPGGQALEVLLT